MKFIPVSEPLITKNDIKSVSKSLLENWVSSDSPYVKRFEDQLAYNTNRKYACCVSSGTAALSIAIRSLELKKGDEVIIPNFTIISGINDLIEIGCKLVYCEPNQFSYNVNTEDILNKITNKTKLILITHVYGLTVDIEKILNVVKWKKIKIIEDAAEVQGNRINGKPCGSFGDISVFSFYANKQITTGEGGVCLTNSSKLHKRLQNLRNLFFDNKRRFIHKSKGYNFRMSSMQAALGLSQLKRLERIIKIRKNIGKLYLENLQDYKNLIQLPLIRNNHSENIFWVFPILIKNKYNANFVIEKLKEKNIGSRNFFHPISTQPSIDQHYIPENFISLRIYRKGLYLPSGLSLTKKQILYISKNLINILKN